jgi:hypothetical protein
MLAGFFIPHICLPRRRQLIFPFSQKPIPEPEPTHLLEYQVTGDLPPAGEAAVALLELTELPLASSLALRQSELT